MEQSEALATLCMKIFDGVAKPCMFFVPVLFLMRVIYASISGSSDELRSTIKGTALFFILTVGFRYIIVILFTIPEAVLSDFRLPNVSNIDHDSKALVALSGVPIYVQYFFECLIALSYWLAATIHALFMTIMSALAPIVFLFSCLLGIGIGIKLFFGLLVLASSWPVMWYGFEEFRLWAAVSVPDSFGNIALELIITLLKAIGPIGMAILSMNSGPGQAMTAGAGAWSTALGIGKAKFGVRDGGSSRFSDDVKNFTPGGWKSSLSGESRMDDGLANSTSQGISESGSDRFDSASPIAPEGSTRTGSETPTTISEDARLDEGTVNVNSESMASVASSDSTSTLAIENNGGGLQAKAPNIQPLQGEGAFPRSGYSASGASSSGLSTDAKPQSEGTRAANHGGRASSQLGASTSSSQLASPVSVNTPRSLDNSAKYREAGLAGLDESTSSQGETSSSETQLNPYLNRNFGVRATLHDQLIQDDDSSHLGK